MCVFNLNSQTHNIDFELTGAGSYTNANAVSGWTISSRTMTSCNNTTTWTPGSPEFSVLSTPVLSFPYLGVILNSPIGGSKIVRLNNSVANGLVTKISRKINVNTSSQVLLVALAGVLESGSHACCEQAKFQVELFDSLGSLIPCSSPVLTGSPCIGATGFNITSGTHWTNWQVRHIDLSPFMGSSVLLEISSSDCVMGDHYGTLLLDARLLNSFCTDCAIFPPTSNVGSSVNFCAGSSQATIIGPPGYLTYSWNAPTSSPISASQASLSTLTLTSAIAGNVYTLHTTSQGGSCLLTHTFALIPSTVSIGAVSSSSCSGGAFGSATVAVTGSGSGYSYTWLNSGNVVVGTFSTISNISPGIYSVVVSAAGTQSASCGSATSTVSVNTNSVPLTKIQKSFCGNEAYLFATSGSNFQWYTNLTPIPAGFGGTASSYTVTTPSNGAVYHLSYMSFYGCKDSIEFTLNQVAPGTLTVPHNPTVCVNSTNGSAVIHLAPVSGYLSWQKNYFIVSSMPGTPAYSSSLNPTSITVYSVTNLSAGGNYSVNAFDGSCKYGLSFSVTPFIFDYTLSPVSATICSGTATIASVNFSTQPTPQEYNISWSPSTFLMINGNMPTVVINPAIPQGSSSTIIYTVVVTPSLVNCPLSKTTSITVKHPLPPVISIIPPLCSSAAAYTIQATPGGGIYTNSPGSQSGLSNGIISPSLSSNGTHSFTYAVSDGNCIAKSQASYTILESPSLSISGNTLICSGNSAVFLASGAPSFSWNNMASGPILSVSPTVSTEYTVTGTNVNSPCSNTAIVTVSVVPLPEITISGNTQLCSGNSSTLAVTGADSYFWSHHTTGSVITVSPESSTSYTVVGTRAAGNCTNSAHVSITVSSCTGLDNLPAKNEHILIYPNPSSGSFIIETENDLLISLYGSFGKKLLEKTCDSGKHSFILHQYTNGIYLLYISGPNFSKIVKLVLCK